MWEFKKLSNGTIKYITLEKSCCVVGRKNCNFLLEDDSSVSRKHCSIYIGKSNDCPSPVNTLTGVWISDEQSKYGTFVKNGSDWLKLKPKENYVLKSKDIIRFGIMENVWRVEYKPVVVCSSGIQTSQRKEIENTLQSIDGIFKNSWTNDCTLLVVNDLTLTVKVVLALISGIPIVKTKYLEKVVLCIKNQEPFPDYKSYRPPIKENVLDINSVSLDPNDKRKNLFKNKKFLIPTKRQFDTLKEVITLAGGQPELLLLSCDWKSFAQKNCIVIQLPLNNPNVSTELSNKFKEVISYLSEKHGKRVIPESEIAQAVAYASIEKFCNPDNCFLKSKLNKQNNSKEIITQETPAASPVIVRDDPAIPSSSVACSENINSFSQQSLLKPSTSRKRTHSPEIIKGNRWKKKTRNNSEDDESEIQNSPKIREVSPDIEFESKNLPGKNSTVLKNSMITNYFFSIGDSSQAGSQNSQKRKLLIEKDVEGESSTPKKSKILPDESEEIEINKPEEMEKQNDQEKLRESVKLLTLTDAEKQKNKNFSQNISKILEEDDNDDNLDGYISRERAEFSQTDLNITIYSSDIVSSNFVKEGCLVEPPSVPTNVKKFKKQKLFNLTIEIPKKKSQEEIFDEEWIEPHPISREILVSGKEGW